MLFTVWLPDPFRPTQDLDLLGFGSDNAADVARRIAAVCAVDVPDDGLVFDVDSIKAETIRGKQDYGGVRVKLTAHLARSRIPVQIDIGFGDAVTPAASEIEFPPLLDLPAPRIRAYPRETVVAEKLQAIVMLGAVNTRLKDYYDLVALSRLFAFDGQALCDAIIATFERRRTEIPDDVPIGLSEEFANDLHKIAQWQAFINREQLLLNPGDLVAAVEDITAFVLPPMKAARQSKTFARGWKAGGPWGVLRKRKAT
jgi:predicted nucleotidyltransferase component of viral defense system